MPWLQKIYETYRSRHLQVIGFTTVNRSATDELVEQFLDENDITFPVFKEDGSARSALDMPGTPFMVMVRDGRFVWEDVLPTENFPQEIVARLVATQD